MRTIPLRFVAFVLALAIPTAGGATERRSSLLVMRAAGPVAEGPVGPPRPPTSEEVVEPAPATVEALPSREPPAPRVEPTATEVRDDAPAVAEPETPTPAVSPADYEAMQMAARAEGTRDIGATAMAASGLVTVGGVVLILAGFGATATAIKQSDCGDSCGVDNPKIARAARVTLAGLAISTLGAVAFVASVAVYGVGNARVQRSRAGSIPAVGLAPSQRGAALSLRGRF